MTPRIFKHAGLWYCRTPGVEGLGYNPRHAYEDWKHMRDRMRNTGRGL